MCCEEAVTVTSAPPPVSASETALPAAWQNSAACRNVDTELFFPIGPIGRAAAEARQAKAICARCPVRQPCLTYALATHQGYGIWGGYDEDERRVLHSRQRVAAAGKRLTGRNGPRPNAPD
jgi:WhiB family transcriptional regulator, redox-sensing transcriptional regulator